MVIAVSVFRWFWSPTGHWYTFWSGVGADLGYLAGFTLVWRRLTCHTRRCWRLGLHHVEGTPYVTCRKHHPTVPDRGARHADIIEAHRAAQE